MSRAFIVAALLGASLAAPPAALGAAPFRSSDHTVTMSCDGITGSVGAAFLGISLSDTYGADAFLDVFAGEPFAEPPVLTRDPNGSVDVTTGPGTLSATIPLVDEAGAAVGNAVVSAALAPAGPASSPESFRDGNVWYKAKGTIQPLAVSGTLRFPSGVVYGLDGCYGEEATISTFQTNPNAFITHFASRTVDCQLSDGAGDTGSLFVDLSDAGDVFISAAATSADGTIALGAAGDLALVGGSVAGDLSTYDALTKDPIADPTTVAMTLAASGTRFTYTLKNATQTQRVSGQAVDIEGTLSFPGSMTFDLGACIAVDASTKSTSTSPRGPKPTGRAPSNDLPAGALPLAPGGRSTVQTKGAAALREVAFPCMVSTDPFTGETFEVMVGSTVWYRIVGTGGSVTLDTAGSDYDTVAAAYTADGAGGYVPVAGACVDDVQLQPVGRTLQAAVTFPTTAGVDYFVQVGGYPQSFTYGTLKVAVR